MNRRDQKQKKRVRTQSSTAGNGFFRFILFFFRYLEKKTSATTILPSIYYSNKIIKIRALFEAGKERSSARREVGGRRFCHVAGDQWFTQCSRSPHRLHFSERKERRDFNHKLDLPVAGCHMLWPSACLRHKLPVENWDAPTLHFAKVILTIPCGTHSPTWLVQMSDLVSSQCEHINNRPPVYCFILFYTLLFL